MSWLEECRAPPSATTRLLLTPIILGPHLSTVCMKGSTYSLMNEIWNFRKYNKVHVIKCVDGGCIHITK